jgi:glycosyltransferase involved in cell wall biosynthesis
MDTYKLYPLANQLQGRRIACWTPVDCDPLGTPDRMTLERAGAVPIAMSQFGLDELRAAGFEKSMYAPHAVDTEVFAPPEDRAAHRRELGVDDRFLIGICGANNDGMRKGYPEQFEAFATFRKQHPEALLMLHTIVDTPRGLNLLELAHDFDISDAITFPDAYAQLCGMIPDDVMAGWYGALDLLSCCSLGEGFGVPIIEAQACGTPVVVTGASAMPELMGDGSGAVYSSPVWNPTHRAWWGRPMISEITDEYEDAFKLWKTPAADKRRADARDFALTYDSRVVFDRYWLPILKTLEAM